MFGPPISNHSMDNGSFVPWHVLRSRNGARLGLASDPIRAQIVHRSCRHAPPQERSGRTRRQGTPEQTAPDWTGLTRRTLLPALKPPWWQHRAGSIPAPGTARQSCHECRCLGGGDLGAIRAQVVHKSDALSGWLGGRCTARDGRVQIADSERRVTSSTCSRRAAADDDGRDALDRPVIRDPSAERRSALRSGRRESRIRDCGPPDPRLGPLAVCCGAGFGDRPPDTFGRAGHVDVADAEMRHAHRPRRCGLPVSIQSCRTHRFPWHRAGSVGYRSPCWRSRRTAARPPTGSSSRPGWPSADCLHRRTAPTRTTPERRLERCRHVVDL